MVKTLWIGDPHLHISRLDVSQRFANSIREVVREKQPERIIVSGDLSHTFAVIRSEVLAIWSELIDDLHKDFEIVLLVGNHDQAGADGGVHGLKTFASRTEVVEFPTTIDGINFMPFMRDIAQFEQYCRLLPPGSGLVCHQSFSGAQFENGFYDPHGADPACVSHLAYVLSGHVHAEQKLNNIYWPGTPYQMSFADAGEKKAIFMMDLEQDKYAILERISLNLPEFVIVEKNSIPELLNAIPEPVAANRYKFKASGTPQEIDSFWKDPKIKSFKSQVKRVEDALVAIRPVMALPQLKSRNLEDRVVEYAETRKWRVGHAELAAAARELLAN